MVGMDDVYAVILAGGGGERFWPFSTARLPKQFLTLFGPRSLLTETVERVRSLVPVERLLVVAGARHAPLIRRHIPDLPRGNLLQEPAGRDTAAAIGLASVVVERRHPDPVMLVFPADHAIADIRGFRRTMRRAVAVLRRHDALVTVGVRPTRPETGYGYILAGEPMVGAPGVRRVRRFLEKPSRTRAVRLARDPRCTWNAGIFAWRNRTIQRRFAALMPELWGRLCRIRDAWGRRNGGGVLAREFARMAKISVDYGILEKSPDVVVVPAAFPWDDLGSWSALERVLRPDRTGNVVVGEHVGIESADCVIYGTEKPIRTLGLKGFIVVDGPDGILVCPKARAQEVKRLRQAPVRRRR
ncbi:MAG: NTP transferase domain-containing protein [candidate division NC10 bacterium]|nr:NTP transferase domain-containing protein [candidate division NC10 bacterium]